MKRVINIFLALFIVSLFVATESQARERKWPANAGERSAIRAERASERVSATSERRAERAAARESGERGGGVNWRTDRGERETKWDRTHDRETKSGTFSSETTGEEGWKTSREGTYQRNEDGSLGIDATRTGVKGRETDINRTVVKNEDGSRTVTGTYTGEDGKTLDVNRTVAKTEEGWASTGDYSTSGGRSGTLESQTKRDGNTWTRDSSATTSEGKTWSRNVSGQAEDGVISKDTTITGPDGKSYEYSKDIIIEDVYVDPQE